MPGLVPATSNALGRIKLVNPPEENMVRGDDGLFRLKQGGVAQLDPNLHLVGGALEGSNVNLVDSMVRMVNLARSYETQITMIKTAQDNASKASQIMNLNA